MGKVNVVDNNPIGLAFESVRSALNVALSHLHPTQDSKALRGRLQAVSEKTYILVSHPKVAKQYRDAALTENSTFVGQQNAQHLKQFSKKLKKRRPLRVDHPAKKSADRLKRLLNIVADRMLCQEEAHREQDFVKPGKKGTKGFHNLLAVDDRETYVRERKWMFKLQNNGMSLRQSYLLTKGLPLLDDLDQKRRPYLRAAAKIQAYLNQGKVGKATIERVALQFIANALEVIAPEGEIVILDHCAYCHRHTVKPVKAPSKRANTDGVKHRGRLCELHRTREHDGERDFTGYARAQRDKVAFNQNLNAVTQRFYALAKDAADNGNFIFLEFADMQSGVQADDQGERLGFFLEAFIQRAPVNQDTRQLLLDCLEQVPEVEWAKFLELWYRAVGDKVAADQIRRITTFNAKQRARLLSLSAETARKRQIRSARLEPSAITAPISLYEPIAFVDDLIRYEAVNESRRAAPKKGRPVVNLDETRILKLSKAGQSTRSIGEQLDVSAEKVRLFLKAHAVADQFGVSIETVKVLQRELLRLKQKGLPRYIPTGESFNLSDKLARSIADALQ